MAEEWVCDDCGHVGTSEGICPDCGKKLVSVGDYDDDLAETDEKYSKKEMKTDVLDDEIDFVGEDEDDEDDEIESDKAA